MTSFFGRLAGNAKNLFGHIRNGIINLWNSIRGNTSHAHVELKPTQNQDVTNNVSKAKTAEEMLEAVNVLKRRTDPKFVEWENKQKKQPPPLPPRKNKI